METLNPHQYSNTTTNDEEMVELPSSSHHCELCDLVKTDLSYEAIVDTIAKITSVISKRLTFSSRL